MLVFLKSIGASVNDDCVLTEGFTAFLSGTHDVIINCIGVGTQRNLRGDYTKYFTTTEQFDNLAINYLREKNPDAIYISLSSGLVYGRGHSKPVDEATATHFQINRMVPEDYYMIARINAETKHRAFQKLNIVDLRLFSYFSRFIDLCDGYFITDVINSILNRTELVTESSNIIRDFVHPSDLFALIQSIIDTQSINDAFDVYSAGRVTKNEILSHFSNHFGLKYALAPNVADKSPTGFKHTYASEYRKVTTLGYQPKYTSIDTIVLESRFILNRSHIM